MVPAVAGGAVERVSGGRCLPQPGVRAAQTGPGQGEMRVDAQRLVEASGRLDPLEMVQVGQTLAEELLRLAGRGRRRIVCAADARLHGNWTAEEGRVHDGKRVKVMRALRRRERRAGARQREDRGSGRPNAGTTALRCSTHRYETTS